MVRIIPFSIIQSEELNDINISVEAVSNIILGPPDADSPLIAADVPSWAGFFIRREYKACEANFRALSAEHETAPHPSSGAPTPLSYCFIAPSNIYPTVTVFKVFGTAKDGFCLVFNSLASRVTHVIIPEHDIIIHDLDRAVSPEIWSAFLNHTQPLSPSGGRRKRIGLCDMVGNYAHQAMNHLSGIQRIIDDHLEDFLDEIWVLGDEFFGKTADVFPELEGKIIHKKMDMKALYKALVDNDAYIFKIGSIFVADTLRKRLINLAKSAPAYHARRLERWPLIAVTVRATNRRCLNLPEVVEITISQLLAKYPDIGIIFDGWAFPESAVVAKSNVFTALKDNYYTKLRNEAALCDAILERLPDGILARNLVGSSLLESIDGLSDAQAYFSHVGTLQHKLSWFGNLQGVVHGPTFELGRTESSYYACAGVAPPVFLPISDVIDERTDHAAGQLSNYSIKDVHNVASLLDNIIINSAR